MEHLRKAKRDAAKVTRAKARVAEDAKRNQTDDTDPMANMRSNSSIAGRKGASGGAKSADVVSEEDQKNAAREVPEWIMQQLPSLLTVLEACKHLVQVR